MSLISVHPIKPLLEAWKRLRLMRGKNCARGSEGKPKQSRVSKPHNRHTAFLELP